MSNSDGVIETTKGLTFEDYKVLRAPFPTSEVEFLRGFTYIREQAVNFRLSTVDPLWEYIITHMEYRSEAHVVVMGYMIVKGVTRYGIGEQKNEPAKDKNTGAILPVKELDCAKGAETDLLKRLARKFMIGLYLTELPNGVSDEQSYQKWFDGQKAK